MIVYNIGDSLYYTNNIILYHNHHTANPSFLKFLNILGKQEPSAVVVIVSVVVVSVVVVVVLINPTKLTEVDTVPLIHLCSVRKIK